MKKKATKKVTAKKPERRDDTVDSFDSVKKWFEAFGYTILEKPAAQDNDCDMYVVGKKRAISVEIKTVRVKQNGCMEADCVTDSQRKCDVCAVVLPNGNVLVDEMSHYLQACPDSGYRQLNWLKL